MSIVNHFRIENVMHVLDPFFFSDQVIVLEDSSH